MRGGAPFLAKERMGAGSVAAASAEKGSLEGIGAGGCGGEEDHGRRGKGIGAADERRRSDPVSFTPEIGRAHV